MEVAQETAVEAGDETSIQAGDETAVQQVGVVKEGCFKCFCERVSGLGAGRIVSIVLRIIVAIGYLIGVIIAFSGMMKLYDLIAFVGGFGIMAEAIHLAFSILLGLLWTGLGIQLFHAVVAAVFLLFPLLRLCKVNCEICPVETLLQILHGIFFGITIVYMFVYLIVFGYLWSVAGVYFGGFIPDLVNMFGLFVFPIALTFPFGVPMLYASYCTRCCCKGKIDHEDVVRGHPDTAVAVQGGAMGVAPMAMGVAPMGVAPMGMAPMGVAPMGMAPMGVAPMGVAPMGMAPMGMAPMGVAPMGMAPMGMAPMGMAPMGVAPMGVAPQGVVPQAVGVKSDVAY